MEPKVNYIVVGLFVIVLVAVSLGIALWLGKSEFRTDYDRYLAYMRESVVGLSVNSPVKYRGVDVGRVIDIRLNPQNLEEVQLTLEIERGTPIKEDTVATLRVQGLTAYAMVDLNGGTRESPPLTAKAGEAYPVIKTTPSLLARLDNTLSKLLDDEKFSDLIQNIGDLAAGAKGLVDEENGTTLRQILDDVSKVTHALAERRDQVDRAIVDASTASSNLAKSTASIREELPTLLRRFNSVAATLEGLSRDTARAGATVSTVLTEAKPSLEQFSRHTLPETGLLVSELRQLTASLKRVASELEREPNALVMGRKKPPRGPGE